MGNSLLMEKTFNWNVMKRVSIIYMVVTLDLIRYSYLHLGNYLKFSYLLDETFC